MLHARGRWRGSSGRIIPNRERRTRGGNGSLGPLGRLAERVAGEKLLTEMSNEELLRTVALDIHKACDA